MLLQVYFLGALGLRKVGKLLKTNRFSVEQAVSNFVLLFSLIVFCSWLNSFFAAFLKRHRHLSTVTKQCCTVQLTPNTDIYSFSTVYVMFFMFSFADCNPIHP